ncbi:MAG: EI24 domain-containing protein [Fimbriimonadaceae bacterium]|nr:EI24 domain-containing protein [Fimbriimonadaceae bacterium]QYK54843.1 MAG: EI24 domain-containing protein [Fimbriimonadaceae bacterium]
MFAPCVTPAAPVLYLPREMPTMLRAFLLVYQDRTLRSYVWRPLLFSALAYLALLLAGFAVLVPWLAHLAETSGLPGAVGWIGGTVVLGVAWFFLSGPIFLVMANLFSAFLWEPLSRRVEERLYGRAEGAAPTWPMLLQDLAFRMPTTVMAALAVAVFGTGCFGLVAVVVAGWMGLNDYTSPAFARRGVVFPRQAFAALRCQNSWTLWLLGGASSLLPFLNVLLVPGWVAMGTVMCRESANPASRPPVLPPRP